MSPYDYLDFQLPDDFVESYANRPVNWGFKDISGNSLGELTFLRSYSRLLPNGQKERWHDTCRRVTEGTYHEQKKFCKEHKLPWNTQKANASAKEFYDRMFNFKWLPPGRGLWAMGTRFVHENNDSTALQNCCFISTSEMTKEHPEIPFAFLMEASMLGVGVGFDTVGAKKNFHIYKPKPDGIHTIADSREGWVEAVSIVIRSYLTPKQQLPQFDFGEIRAAGELIKGFGGIASGPQPLVRLLGRLTHMFETSVGGILSSKMIVDIMNIIGVCVVSGNVRRCLPQGTLIHTTEGLIPIELALGKQAQTASGKALITRVFNQGLQPTITIQHKHGVFTCTPNHRMAVFDGLTTKVFKKAKDLIPGDRLVWDFKGCDGVNQVLPNSLYNKSTHDHTSKELVIPTLDEGIAWLIGLIQGDGYVFVPKNCKTPNGYVSIACHAINNPEIVTKAKEQLKRFGVEPKISYVKNENTIKVQVFSTEFANYVYQNFKQPSICLRTPSFILQAPKTVRAAYLAGLFDSDGSSKTRPLQGVITVYEPFSKDIHAVYASLGVSSKISTVISKNKNWKTKFSIDLVGYESVVAFNTLVAPYSAKYTPTTYLGSTIRSSNGFTFATEEVRKLFKGHWITGCANQTTKRISDQTHIQLLGYPLEVISITQGDILPTYDIEVDKLHEFTAEGLVTHNSAELSLGDINDPLFTSLKDYTVFPERSEWGFMSNNSLRVKAGINYEQYVEQIVNNGEPGFLYEDLIKSHGRLIDPPNYKDHRATGTNPCSEQTLESMECCTLTESFPTNCDDKQDFIRTLKYAYLYAKTVTLIPTHWQETNAIMQRNRRIGTSMSGLAQFIENKSRAELREWMIDGYEEIQRLDKSYSEWLGIRESIKTTSVKPSGSVSLLAGVSPGVHWPVETRYIRRIIVGNNDPLAKAFSDAGYNVVPSAVDPDTSVVIELPIEGFNIRNERKVSIFEKADLAELAQFYWADNQVSCTITFDRETEAKHIPVVLRMFEGRLKSISFLPIDKATYPQMPYEALDEDEYKQRIAKTREVDWASLYKVSSDAEAERGCTNDVCELK